MSNTLLLDLNCVAEEQKDNKPILGKQEAMPFFIEIYKEENKKIKIPCSNENIAVKVLDVYKRLKVRSKKTTKI